MSLGYSKHLSLGQVCRQWLQIQGATCTMIIATVDFVLMFRVWIMYERRRSLILVFVALTLAEIVIMATIDSLAYNNMREFVHLGPSLTGCHSYETPRFLSAAAATPVLIGFIMFVMTVYKCGITLRLGNFPATSMWKLFLRDGVLWFLGVFTVGVAVLVIWTLPNPKLKQLLIIPSLVVYSIVASRSMLNIKEAMLCESVMVED
ncbi:hypothetical protein B0H10DRAFT_80256 [Mycena sp. CBHHK59/15]|nr:hypothetical protein B0H10DRAFT_80256 [Mycena sp. CBHHK59/15]